MSRQVQPRPEESYTSMFGSLIVEVVNMGVAFYELLVELCDPAINWGRVNPLKFSLFFLLLPSMIGVPLIVLA